MVICEYKFALTKEPYFSTPYIIKEYDNVRIAIVGLTADGLMKNEFAEMEKEVSIEKHYYLLNAGLDIYMKVNILTS